MKQKDLPKKNKFYKKGGKKYKTQDEIENILNQKFKNIKGKMS